MSPAAPAPGRGALAGAVVIGTLLVLYAGLLPIVDLDLWWHLRLGADLLARGLQRHDIYSTDYFGAPYDYLPWLSEAVLAYVHQSLGVPGLHALRVFLLGLTVAGAVRATARRHSGDRLVLIATVVLCACAVVPRSYIRTLLFGLPLLALLAAQLAAYDAQPAPSARRRLWWWLPGAALWTNLHQSVLFAQALFGVLALAHTSRLLANHSESTGRRAREAGELWALFACVVLASFANPYGYNPLFAAKMRAEIFTLINEWKAIEGADVTATLVATHLLAGLALLRERRRRPFYTLGVLAAFDYAAFRHARFLTTAMLVLLPTVVPSALAWLRERLGGPRRGVVTGLLLLLCVADTTARLVERGLPSAGVRRESFPIDAAEFVATLPPGPVLNAYDFGGYLLYRLGADYPLHIDGRTGLLHDGAHFAAHVELTRAPAPRLSGPAFERYPIAVVKYDAIAEALGASPRWALVDVTDLALVYVRRIPRYADVIARGDLTPLSPLHLAQLHADWSWAGPHRDAAARLAERHPQSGVAHLLHAVSLAGVGNTAGARAAFSVSAARFTSPLIDLQYGAFCARQGDSACALVHLTRYIEENGAAPRAYLEIARALAQEGRMEEARAAVDVLAGSALQSEARGILEQRAPHGIDTP